MIPVKPFNPSYDRTAKYTIKEVAAITGLSAHTIRYYDNENLECGIIINQKTGSFSSFFFLNMCKFPDVIENSAQEDFSACNLNWRTL